MGKDGMGKKDVGGGGGAGGVDGRAGAQGNVTVGKYRLTYITCRFD